MDTEAARNELVDQIDEQERPDSGNTRHSPKCIAAKTRNWGTLGEASEHNKAYTVRYVRLQASTF
jgi:hypothetical protein